MKFILGLVVLLLATTGMASEVSVAGSRADVKMKFSGYVSSVGIAVEKSAAMVTIMDGGCQPYYPGIPQTETDDQGQTIYHPHKPGHDCDKTAMKIGLDLKAEGDKLLYDFFSHAHGGVTVATSNGKIEYVRSSAGCHGGSCEPGLPGPIETVPNK